MSDEKELNAAYDEFMRAGQAYWKALRKFNPRLGGAIAWIEGPEGFALYTRGEYRDTILRNVHDCCGPAYVFGGTVEGPDEN